MKSTDTQLALHEQSIDKKLDESFITSREYDKHRKDQHESSAETDNNITSSTSFNASAYSLQDTNQ